MKRDYGTQAGVIKHLTVFRMVRVVPQKEPR